jgi:hypothetical protein
MRILKKGQKVWKIANDVDSPTQSVTRSRKVFSDRLSSNVTRVSKMTIANDADSPNPSVTRVSKMMIANDADSPSPSVTRVSKMTIANDADSPSPSVTRVSNLTIANDADSPSPSVTRVSNLTIANDADSPSPSVLKSSLSFTYSPICKTRGLRNYLSTVRQQQARRLHTRMTVRVDPKKIRFICGINRYKDDNYEYMLRVDDGQTDLSTFSTPFKLNIFAYDVSNIKETFDRLVLIGEAKTVSSQK